uniref:Methyltransferase HEMK2 n=1 Tax=Pristionchus pacificus TaxID=54126 RepID=A0A2A6CW06_PRIPA|eukprot:PDM82227.1 methyltransferase [Pristionchus pacificus]
MLPLIILIIVVSNVNTQGPYYPNHWYGANQGNIRSGRVPEFGPEPYMQDGTLAPHVCGFNPFTRKCMDPQGVCPGKCMNFRYTRNTLYDCRCLKAASARAALAYHTTPEISCRTHEAMADDDAQPQPLQPSSGGSSSSSSGEMSPLSTNAEPPGSPTSSTSSDSSSSSSSVPGPSALMQEAMQDVLDEHAASEELARQVAAAAPALTARHYHHAHAHGHSHAPHHHHAHSHSHSHSPPANPQHRPVLPAHLPPPANPNNLRPIQANRQRTVRVPIQQHAGQNSNQLGAVRDRLFQAMLVRMALWYTARVNRTWRKVIELVAITLAILSFLSLAMIHTMFMKVSTTCLKDIEPTWPRDGIVRVELVRNLAMLRKKEEQYQEYRQQHLDELARSPPPVCRFSRKEVLQKGPAALPAEIREFGYLARRVREIHDQQPAAARQPRTLYALIGTAIGYIWPDESGDEKGERDDEGFEPIETEEELAAMFDSEFNHFYEPDELPYYEYRVEYSLIYGLLRLPAKFLHTHNVSVMTKQIDADDSCLGTPTVRWLMTNVVGFEDPILHTLKALAVNESEIGYVHDLRSNDHYHFVQLATSRMSYVTAGVVMLLFTFAISLLLRFSHHQIFLFIVDLLHMFEHNQPLAFPAAPLLTVILALVGMEAIMSEVFNDTTTAFYVILIVWLADQFDAICCQSPTSKRYWLRFFFLHQFFFYSYQYRFGGVYGGLALLTSSLSIMHSMIFFFHHYEIPLILYTDRLQRIMGELNGRIPMADPPIVQEVNLATGPPTGEGEFNLNRAAGSPPHAVNGIRRVILPRNGPQRPMIGIPLTQQGRPIEQGLEERLVAAAERRVREIENAHEGNTWIRSIARSVGGRLVNTIPSWMVGAEQQPIENVVDQVGERIRFRLPRGTAGYRPMMARRTTDGPVQQPAAAAPEAAADAAVQHGCVTIEECFNDFREMLPTPSYRLTERQKASVYDPAEDSFLLMDAIEKDLEVIKSLHPRIALEIGVGSGVISAFLAKSLPSSSLLSLGTDVNEDACEAARTTAEMNGVRVEVVRCDIVSALLPRLADSIDILLFNPPYVPTDQEEVDVSDLARCWAGGARGITTLQRLLPTVPNLLSMGGLFYLVALKENGIDQLLKHSERLRGSIVMERRAGIEYLYILKFERVL